ncbi:MAG: hypothetical protein QOF33_71 [Thermomicrobiales bacterium]|nr:hypothetical protein [Thermomicrobiales bacterium]MEA2528248.1 hypothetical protein [Thermomicrobiales bacterium]MEA2531790.1 hypothetical protein [Thermomicrobiales bacterium]MEA2581986.1 hypothetical protein [Thermomicrobiales bacterium]MEA2596809.1 hypothetical protein [Thermomicrobiales bacterium]
MESLLIQFGISVHSDVQYALHSNNPGLDSVVDDMLFGKE